jgi:hypothetical protein
MVPMMTRLLLFPVALLLTSCACMFSRLSVQSNYITVDDLASMYVHTPDPRQCCPTLGQRLTICWALESELEDRYQQFIISARIVFRNHEETKLSIPLDNRYGTYLFSIVDDDFFEKKGILTYKVELLGDGEVIDIWQHQMWAEIIRAKD